MSDLAKALTAPEAERALLGALLLNPDLIPQAESLVQSRHLYDEKHRLIYAAVLSLHERGAEPDLVTVRRALVDAGQDVAAGGAPYLAGLLDGMPRVTNVDQWARLVRERARRRAALDLARRFAVQCESGAEETDAIIDELRSGLERLTDAGQRGIQSIADVVRESLVDLEEFVQSPRGLVGITTGISDLDRMTGGLKPGQLWIVAAFTSRGKSSLCTQAATTAAGTEKRVLMYSMEMPPPDVVERMILGRAGIDRWSLRTQQGAWDRVSAVSGQLAELPIWFDPREAPTAAEVRSSATRHKHATGCDLVVVDHLQRMARDPKLQGDDWLSVGSNCISLKSLARRLNVPVLCACQLNAEAEDKRPSMANLSRARATIMQEADVILFLHPRDMKEWDDRSIQRPSVTLIVAKQRKGSTGDIPTIFDRALTRFYGITEDSRA